MQTLRLHKAPTIKIEVGGDSGQVKHAKEYILSNIDTPGGYKKNQIYIENIVNALGKMSKSNDNESQEASAKQFIEAVRFWFWNACSQEAYDEIFSTPEARNNVTWHEQLYIMCMAAIAESRTNMVNAVANSPEVQKMKEELLHSLNIQPNGIEGYHVDSGDKDAV